MKKVAILTWLNNENYGSILQAYALQAFIKNNGYNVVDIDYDASNKAKLINWIKNRNSLNLFGDKIKRKTSKIFSKNTIDFSQRKLKFKDFKKENIVTTRKYSSPKELIELRNKYDIYVCGSDQIWSPKLMNPVFYFSFLDKDDYKISYAPSLGVSNIDDRKKELIKELLKGFNFISVREEKGKELLKDLTKKDITVQLDPTLLLCKEDWEKLLINRNNINNEYIFLYLLTPNEKYIEKVKEIAKRENLNVKVVLTDIGPYNTGFEELSDVGPLDWLTLIKGAKYVFTDSFHGSIFSIIFNKQFILFKRFNDMKKGSENSRIINLSKKFGFEDRIADENTKIGSITPIDYTIINKKMYEERIKSQKWLLNALAGEENE